MKLCRCPVCHSDIHLDQLEDDAGRELLGLITELKYGVARPLVSYIALFRPDKSALSNSRAIKLMREVLAMFPASQLLAHSLSETVNAVQKKRKESRNLAPLNNHRYLMQVMETNKPLFSGVGSAAINNEERKQAERLAENDEIENTILYIERFHQLGQPVEHLPGYEVWKKWKENQSK
ncbi:hypothetical protein MY652_03080 [Haemophilus influenzae]|uniref:hypothetical protein n=1 Tax=Haemophilus influenzae TaxID=727 RepID=UPI00014FCA67|nr:hypothetical protein [Haemophilus influenzae]EDK09554.1 hypothetical protein CGSHiHH_00593 [Haemophilus influenzae PittHH]KIP37251.1 hypothetical protein SU30_01575 [Haemophilus influenzae]KIP48829.1 hypothetical protein SU59_06100 [Haemophilus influenzae]KMZ32765.1 hypothetical protein ABN30_02790 [Haemophilus influenzae]MBZ5691710.1 hypothetical protein [Haemophilus influenzae]